MQLAIAIIFIIVLMNLWLSNVRKDEFVLAQHFSQMGEQYLQQTAMSISQLQQTKKKKSVEQFIQKLVEQEHIKSVQVYDAGGQKVAEAGQAESALSLYGADTNSPDAKDNSDQFTPFVMSLTSDPNSGFVRLDVKASVITQALAEENNNQQQLARVMLLMAGCAGFFLTRGLSRFSRQGFRVANQKQQA